MGVLYREFKYPHHSTRQDFGVRLLPHLFPMHNSDKLITIVGPRLLCNRYSISDCNDLN